MLFKTAEATLVNNNLTSCIFLNRYFVLRLSRNALENQNSFIKYTYVFISFLMHYKAICP